MMFTTLMNSLKGNIKVKLALFNKTAKGKNTKINSKAQPKKKFILSRKQKIAAIVGGVLVLGGAGYAAYAAYTMDEVSAGGCVSSTYKKGAKSSCVKYAQQMLGISADSSFGTGTANAAKSFQRKHGLTADGIIGPNTWKKLCSVSSNASAKKKAGCNGSDASSSKKWKVIYSEDLCSIAHGSWVLKDGTYGCNIRNGSGSVDRYRGSYAYSNEYTSLCRVVARSHSNVKWDNSLKPQGMYTGRSGMTGMCVKES